MNKISLPLWILGLWMAGCQSNTSKQPTPAQRTEAVSKQQIETTTLAKHLITDVIECTGKIDVPPNQRAAIYTPIGGMITNIRILPGDLVKKGQVLFSLEHQDIVKIQENYLVAKNEYALRSVDFERKQKLFEAGSISDRELRQIQHDYQVAKAGYNSLKTQLRLIGLPLERINQGQITGQLTFRAPINGYVAEVFAVAGAYVNVNSAVLTLVNTEHKHVELEIYADKISQLQPGQEVRFHMAGSGKPYFAEVHLVGKEVQPDTRTVQVHAHLKNEEDPSLVVGAYLYATVLVKNDSVYSLPQEAIVHIDNKDYILLQDPQGLTPVEVTTGKTFDGFVEILNYQAFLDQPIVSKNAYYYME